MERSWGVFEDKRHCTEKAYQQVRGSVGSWMSAPGLCCAERHLFERFPTVLSVGLPFTHWYLVLYEFPRFYCLVSSLHRLVYRLWRQIGFKKYSSTLLRIYDGVWRCMLWGWTLVNIKDIYIIHLPKYCFALIHFRN